MRAQAKHVTGWGGGGDCMAWGLAEAGLAKLGLVEAGLGDRAFWKAEHRAHLTNTTSSKQVLSLPMQLFGCLEGPPGPL